MLTGAGFVGPASTSITPEEDGAASRSLNAMLLARAEAGAGVDYLAAPKLGAAINVTRIEQMFILADSAGDADPVERVRTTLVAQGQFLVVEGETIQEEERTRTELKRIYDEFKAQKADLLQRLGVC